MVVCKRAQANDASTNYIGLMNQSVEQQVWPYYYIQVLKNTDQYQTLQEM